MNVSSHRIRISAVIVLYRAAVWTAAFGSAACGNSTDRASSTDNASSDEDVCGKECDLELLSPCTCGTDDPCGFRNDGVCDRDCLFENIVDSMFDDAKDCPGPCDGACEAGFYTACTCDIDDPCGWAEDASCDADCTETGVTAVMFDDSADCMDGGR